MLETIFTVAIKEYGLTILPYVLLFWAIKTNLRMQKDQTTALVSITKALESLEKWVSLAISAGNNNKNGN